jgi:hypothetical protein
VLGSYRVFGCSGYATDDILIEAIDRAVRDGCDVINLSLATGSGYADWVSWCVQRGLSVSSYPRRQNRSCWERTCPYVALPAPIQAADAVTRCPRVCMCCLGRSLKSESLWPGHMQIGRNVSAVVHVLIIYISHHKLSQGT